MNEVLAIYDITGHILMICSGDMYKPVGVPSMNVVIPEGKVLSKIDMTVTPNTPVFEDAPTPTINALEGRLDLLEAAFNYLALQ